MGSITHTRHEAETLARKILKPNAEALSKAELATLARITPQVVDAMTTLEPRLYNSTIRILFERIEDMAARAGLVIDAPDVPYNNQYAISGEFYPMPSADFIHTGH